MAHTSRITFGENAKEKKKKKESESSLLWQSMKRYSRSLYCKRPLLVSSSRHIHDKDSSPRFHVFP